MVVFGLSIWILVERPSYINLSVLIDMKITVYSSGAIVLLIVSIVSILLSCFGCLGAIKEHRCMLATVSHNS